MSHYRMCNHKTGTFIKLCCFYKPTYPAPPMHSWNYSWINILFLLYLVYHTCILCMQFPYDPTFNLPNQQGIKYNNYLLYSTYVCSPSRHIGL